MAIVFHKESRCFHLYNNEVSYIIRIMENEQLEQLYYGKRIHDREDFTYFHEECMRSQMSINVPEPGILSMQSMKFITERKTFFRCQLLMWKMKMRRRPWKSLCTMQ